MAASPWIRTRDAGIDEVEAMQTMLDNMSLERNNVKAQSLATSGPVDIPRDLVTCDTGGHDNMTVGMMEPETPQEVSSTEGPDAVMWVPANPERPVLSGTHLLDIPVEILELLCQKYLDICSNTCLGLTCKSFFNITEHLYPFQVSLYARTLPTRKCLGHLLTQWMSPKYSFDHSWGRFKLKRHYIKDEAEVERRWKEKESWPRIRLVMDGMGATVAYRAKRKGFEEMEHRFA